MFRKIITFILLMYATVVMASEIKYLEKEGIVSIEGEIEAGDFVKFSEFLDSKKKYVALSNFVMIDSPGGDVQEAMKFATFFSNNYIRTKTKFGGMCASSCFIMWSGGIHRLLETLSSLGVHRVSWTAPTTDIKLYESKVGPTYKTVEDFLRNAGIPRKIIDKMNETSPASISKIDFEWIQKEELIGAYEYRPAFLDVVEKKCGVEPKLIKYKDMEQLEKWIDCQEDMRWDMFKKNIPRMEKFLSMSKK